MEGNNNDADIFVYTEGAIVPRDVVRARIDPSVTLIPPRAFSERKKLVDVELEFHQQLLSSVRVHFIGVRS